LTESRRFQLRERDLRANERGSVGIAVLFEEVGGDEPQRVVVGFGDDGGHKRGPVGVLHTRLIRYALLAAAGGAGGRVVIWGKWVPLRSEGRARDFRFW
jgi:hypothetical protein